MSANKVDQKLIGYLLIEDVLKVLGPITVWGSVQVMAQIDVAITQVSSEGLEVTDIMIVPGTVSIKLQGHNDKWASVSSDNFLAERLEYVLSRSAFKNAVLNMAKQTPESEWDYIFY